MCEGFSTIVMRDGRILWVEPDSEGNISHSDILRRAEIDEYECRNESPADRSFVRSEIPSWDNEKSFHWDEQNTLPIWLEEEEMQEKICKLMIRVKRIKDMDLTLEQKVAKWRKLPGFLMGEPLYRFTGKATATVAIAKEAESELVYKDETCASPNGAMVAENGKTIKLTYRSPEWFDSKHWVWHRSWLTNISEGEIKEIFIGYK